MTYVRDWKISAPHLGDSRIIQGSWHIIIIISLIIINNMDEVEQNIVICQWRADQLFSEAKG